MNATICACNLRYGRLGIVKSMTPEPILRPKQGVRTLTLKYLGNIIKYLLFKNDSAKNFNITIHKF